MENGKIWTRDYILLLTSNFLVAISFYLLMTSMAVFAIQQFKASESSAGFAASIFVIGALVARIFAGKYIDVIGRKKMLYSGLCLFLLSSITYLIVTSMEFLMIIRFIHGVAFGISTTVLITVSMEALPHDKRGEGTGYFSLSTASATAIGPFLALFLTNHFSYDSMFIFCIVFSALALVSTSLGTIAEIELTPEQKENMKKGFRLSDFYEKEALPISLLMFISGIAYSCIISFINSYAIEIQLTEAASYFFVVYAIFLLISRPIAGKLFDTKGENIVVYPSMVFFAISFLFIGFAKSGFILLLAGVFLAFGYGTLMSSMQTLAVKVSPPHRIALAISTFFICMDAGLGIGAYLIGLIVEQVGFHTTYIVLGITIFFLIPVYYLVHGKKASKEMSGQY
ncbi:MFS transporter [Bacillus tuaregi]|uniref:MFS transporter n=1 Tax=Bacillus tuaregi TaxID=1816695 RepID=UPI0008F839B0|nr:MFS transporter [Bacillus tuaregi]